MLGCAAPVFAAPTIYSNIDNVYLAGGGAHPNTDAAEAAFLAAAGTVIVQNFDGLTPGNAPTSFAVGTLTATLAVSATQETTIADATTIYATFAVSGNQFLHSRTAQNTTYYTVEFDRPVRALGFHISDASDWFNTGGEHRSLIVTLLYAGGASHAVDLFDTLDPVDIVNGNLGYFGVIDDASPLRGFSIANPLNPDEDAIGLDNLAVAAVPLPAAVWALVPALGLLGSVRRRPQH
jgi:hypothetical protein